MDKFSKDFVIAISNHSDPETVLQGLPAYLLLMDSLANKESASPQMIAATARLYTAYASLFVEDKQRRQRLSGIALKYAELALCKVNENYCNITSKTFNEFARQLTDYQFDNLQLVYTLGQSWGLWIQANSADWNAIAQLAQVKWIMKSIIEKDETIDNGGAHVILGVINTLVPPAMGGKPELAKSHFEKALAITNSRNLSVKVALAENYARLVFDQELHDKLLKEVLSADPNQQGFVLVNKLAQLKARKLLATSPDYF